MSFSSSIRFQLLAPLSPSQPSEKGSVCPHCHQAVYALRYGKRVKIFCPSTQVNGVNFEKTLARLGRECKQLSPHLIWGSKP